MDNLLIRKLKFLEFLRVGVGEHEEGRGFSLYVLTRPDCKLSWNRENNMTVVYDDEGNPWVRWHPVQRFAMDSLFSELRHDKHAHVPHAYDHKWIGDNFGGNPLTDSFFLPLPLTNSMREHAITRPTTPRKQALYRIGYRRTCPGSDPITEEELVVFETWTDEQKPRPRVGESISPPLSEIRKPEAQKKENLKSNNASTFV